MQAQVEPGIILDSRLGGVKTAGKCRDIRCFIGYGVGARAEVDDIAADAFRVGVPAHLQRGVGSGACRRPGISRQDFDRIDIHAAIVDLQAQDMQPGAETDGFTYGFPRLPAAGIGNGDCPGDIAAIHQDAGQFAAVGGGHAQVDGIGARAGHVDGIFQPFSGLGGAHHITSADVGRDPDIHIVTAEIAAGVTVGGVGVGNPVAAIVVIFGLDQARDRPGRAAIGFLYGVDDRG